MLPQTPPRLRLADMESLPAVWIIVGLVVAIVVLRVMFKVAGWILKLLVLVAVGFAIWWLFRGAA